MILIIDNIQLNNWGAPLLGLAKSLYYGYDEYIFQWIMYPCSWFIVDKTYMRKSDLPRKPCLWQSTFKLEVDNLASIAEEQLDDNSENAALIATRTLGPLLGPSWGMSEN